MKFPKVRIFFFFSCTILISEVSISKGAEKADQLSGFLRKWLAQEYTTWPVISKAEKTHVVIASTLDQELVILHQLQTYHKPVITGAFRKEVRKKHELFHALTVITSVVGPNSKRDVSAVLESVFELGWKRKDDFLFISGSTSVLLHEIYSSKVVKALKHRIGYALDTETVFVDPHIYNVGIPYPLLKADPSNLKREPAMGYALQGRHIRVSGCVDLPPYHFLRSKHPVEQDGSQYRIILSASKVFNFTFEVYFKEGSGYGSLDANGTWTGMIGNLIYPERNFDLAIIFGHLYHFFDKFDFVGTVSCSTIRFWQAQPVAEEVSWKALFAPFNWDIWGLTTIAYVIFSLAMWKVFQNFAVGAEMSKPAQLYLGFLIPYKIAMDQTVPIVSDGIRKIAVPWFVLTLITGTAYRTVMISFLTFPSYPTVPSTWDELSQREDYKMMLFNTGAVESLFFQESQSPTIQKINSHLISVERQRGKDCFYGALFHDKAVCIGWYPDTVSRFLMTGIINRNNLREEPYLISKDAALFTSATIPFQKDSIFTDSFTPIVVALVDTGIYRKWMDDGFLWFKKKGLENEEELMSDSEYGDEYRNGLRRIEESGIGGERPLKIGNLLVVFCVLVLGLIVSSVVVVGEVSKSHFNVKNYHNLFFVGTLWILSAWWWKVALKIRRLMKK